jgi:hypothetical protein
MKTVHAVLKLTNGEEVIGKMKPEELKYWMDIPVSGTISVYDPMKASVEQYYERDGEAISVFEKTMMTSWIRFGDCKVVQLPMKHVIIVVEPHEQIIETYDDLILKYDTYKTNPELADQLYGSVGDVFITPDDEDDIEDEDDEDDEPDFTD